MSNNCLKNGKIFTGFAQKCKNSNQQQIQLVNKIHTENEEEEVEKVREKTGPKTEMLYFA